MTIDQKILDEIALTRFEYNQIVEKLGRIPNSLELGLFGALWSEHCGYKHTKELIKTIPNNSPDLLVTPGSENAGIIDIGEGYAIAFKIESHNHPSAIEPFEGAATGVGGIVRDIFAMGARPIALLNSLRFGSITKSRTKYIFNGVISGISAYGNCIGVPNIGGEVYFHKSYNDNPLVNAMCIGLIKEGNYISASAKNQGDLLLLVGSDTGRDGIHGASGLASKTFDNDTELRSTVQVGNPFMEKNLIEACLESINHLGVNGLQDCGAAGLTSAAVEMAERSQLGLEIYIENIPRREKGMNAYEVMLSESQERMLLAVNSKYIKPVIQIFEKWDLDASVIGKFVKGNELEILENKKILSKTSINILTDPPTYKLNGTKPKWMINLQDNKTKITQKNNLSQEETFIQLLESPNLSSRRSIYRQYDHHVQTNTLIEPGGDAALIRIDGSSKGIAVSTDCNSTLCYLDPYIGTLIAVSESCRNVSLTGATPVALTNGLNFGNPKNNDVQFQLTESIKGLKDAANKFKIPIISGNASLFNESEEEAIYPTPIIGSVGVLNNINKLCTMEFKNEGDFIFILGSDKTYDYGNCLSGSEYMKFFFDEISGKPKINIEKEVSLQKICRELIDFELINSAHDCSDGGLSIAIAESAIIGNIGAKIYEDIPLNWEEALFGETQSRIIITTPKDKIYKFEKLLSDKIPYKKIGEVTGEKIIFGETFKVKLISAQKHFNDGLQLSISD